jgi:hypothetical protein
MHLCLQRKPKFKGSVKERKKERKLPVPQFLGLGFRDATMMMVLWVGSCRGVLATIAVFLGYCLLQAPPT